MDKRTDCTASHLILPERNVISVFFLRNGKDEELSGNAGGGWRSVP